LKKLFLVCTALALAFQARTSPLAIVVLNTANGAVGKPPADWSIKVNRGRPEVSVCSEGEGSCVRLKSVKSSFALERGIDVDVNQTPYLHWKWKVAQLPQGGDFRRSGTDDQAAQLLVAFTDRRVISYIWDSTAPKGTARNAGFIPLVHVYAVVCQSGAADLNRWISESHNVAADYERAYGKPAPRVKGLRIQINSQHTGTTAESYFGEVAFRSTPL
jgi:hypothetical protein